MTTQGGFATVGMPEAVAFLDRRVISPLREDSGSQYSGDVRRSDCWAQPMLLSAEGISDATFMEVLVASRRWMVALDDPGAAETIVRWTRQFTHPKNIAITLVHVLEELDLPEAIGEKGHQLLLQQHMAVTEVLLDRARRLLEGVFASVEVVLREGPPGEELLRFIRSHQPELVITGMSGLSRTSGAVLGSVSHRLVSDAPCSVLLVPGQAPRRQGLHAMLATDGSPDAQRAAQVLAALPGVREILIVSVVRPLGVERLVLEQMHDPESRTLQARLLRDRRQAAHQAIRQAEAILREGPAVVTTRLLSGHPAETIVQAARRADVDLLVVGSRGLTGVKALALGSVSQAVTQLAGCPVLIVKREA